MLTITVKGIWTVLEQYTSFGSTKPKWSMDWISSQTFLSQLSYIELNQRGKNARICFLKLLIEYLLSNLLKAGLSWNLECFSKNLILLLFHCSVYLKILQWKIQLSGAVLAYSLLAWTIVSWPYQSISRSCPLGSAQYQIGVMTFGSYTGFLKVYWLIRAHVIERSVNITRNLVFQNTTSP